VRGWVGRMPALDNGEFLWGLVAVAQGLDRVREHKGCGQSIQGLDLARANTSAHAQPSLSSDCARILALLQSYRNYVEWLKHTAVAAFYIGQGSIASIVSINDPQGDPLANGTITPRGGGVLDDPYEGELMAAWLYLSGLLPDGAKGEDDIWVLKRPLLKSRIYSGNGTEC